MTQIKSINLSPTKISLENRKKSHFKSGSFFFIIMRLNLKAVLLCLSVAVIVITFSIYMRCSDFRLPHDFVSHNLYQPGVKNNLLSLSEMRNIECNINQEYTVQCKTNIENSEVYVPFSLIKKQFEISGTLVAAENGATRFNWMHSNSKINVPKGKYDPHGIFMYFENYNVEIRDRVKCISAAEGVPISTQWEKRGYFYPTQIAQFGLSHYSKNFTEAEPSHLIVEDADTYQRSWLIPKTSNISRIWIQKFNTTVVKFETGNEFENAISTKINAEHRHFQSPSIECDLVLSCDVFLVTNTSSMLVTLENLETKRSYNISYILSDLLISAQNENIYYGLGLSSMNHWKHLTRDLFIDLQKGLKGLKLRRGDFRITSIALLGIGMFDNLTISSYDHMAHFYDAAEWFVNNQDKKTGGWSNPVRRNLLGFAELKSGWLSAMGQGHAISLLSRAYWHSKDKKYLRAASNGLKPFRIYSKDGGVLASFMGKYNWYEEYPTTPASYVLNGFIYSLLGLYDLNNTAPPPIANEARKLFRQGMISLKKMLTLFDTGSGTNYDLRHFSLGVSPNLARWDYHATHVNQLLLLATIDSDPLIAHTAERWKGYMFGKRAKHN